MLADLDTTLKASARRLLLERWVRAFRVHLIVTLLAVGVAVLLSRTLYDVSRTTASWSLLALALTPLTAWLQARRQSVSRRSVAAWLDLRGGGDGSIVTAMERDDPRWSERVKLALAKQPAFTPLAVDGALTRTMPAVCFIVLALWIEMPRNLLGPAPEMFEGAIERLEEKLETLAELVELEPEEEEEFQERLERLQVEAEDGTPESFYEAADSLEEALEQTAEELAEEANELEQKLAAVANADESQSEEAESALRESVTELGELGFAEDLSEQLSPEMRDSLDFPEGMELNGELMQELSEELREALKAQLEKLQAAGLLDPSKLRKLTPGELAKMRKTKPSLGKPCDCAECIKAGKKTSSADCLGEGACHNKECMDAGYCIGGGT